MKILYITCALLAITIGSFADNTAAKPTDKADNQQSNPVTTQTVPSQPEVKQNETTTAVPQAETPTIKPNPEPPKPEPKPEPQPTVPPTGTTAHPNAAGGNKTTPNIPTADNKTVTPVVPSTPTKPTTPPTQEPTTKASTTTPATTKAVPTTIHTPNGTDAQSTTTAHPDTTMASSPSPSKERHFDGLSFFGGITLSVCLMSLSAIAWKLYKRRRDGHYRTL